MLAYKAFAFLGICSFLNGFLRLPWFYFPGIAVTFGTAFYLGSGGWRYLLIVLQTLPRDLSGILTLIHVKKVMAKHNRNNETIGNIFTTTIVDKYPNKTAFIDVDTGKTMTFSEADQLANKLGNVFYGANYQKDDVVAIFMASSPEYVCYWLGLSKIGVISALINFNLRGESLAHCINISGAKSVIYSKSLSEAISEVKDSLDKELQFYCVGDDSNIPGSSNLENLLQQSATSKPPEPKNRSFFDKLMYIYTSGTTGLPKAAVIKHGRFFYMSYGLGTCFNVTSNDVNYIPLPLYHSNGGIVGIGMTLLIGNTAAIRNKFSASKFFEDCGKYGATLTHYIGETCRYMLAQPPRDSDKSHKLRLALGNGLRPQIWEEFQTRFNIKQIGEFYGSTEGNANVLNIDNKKAAVGFNSVLAPWFFPLKLFKVDEVTGELLRGADGLAIPCGYNEPGEMIGKIKNNDPLRKFDGYLNKQATSKKIVHDIFTHGDSCFLTGDILYQDEYGYFFFHDRTGDTFRWKGENVSTAEVESIIGKILGLRDVVVYGVNVPGTEGKAGMAAIADPDNQIDLNELLEPMQKSLPAYARPVFIRKQQEISTTGTFKYQKVQLRKDGFDPSKVKGDALYFFDQKTQTYEVLNTAVYKQLLNCKIRL
eukprot:gene10551-19283_t